MQLFPMQSAVGKARMSKPSSNAKARIRESVAKANTRFVVDSLRLMLPTPPSSNALFANSKTTGRKGRTLTQSYRDWIKDAGVMLQAQHVGRIMGTYEISISIPRSEGKRHLDLGNCEKAISDLLVKHGVIEDDSLAEMITIYWSYLGYPVVDVKKWRP